jgi:peptide/nickel transport system substrate-binding protein
MKIRKALAALLATCMVVGTLAACETKEDADTTTTAPAAGETTTTAAGGATTLSELPRNETLYFGGQQWGTVISWNPYGSGQNNSMAIAGGSSKRIIMFETTYMYNLLDGKLMPLLADGDYSWNDEATKAELTFKIKAAAKWNDGTDITAADYEYLFDTYEKYDIGGFTTSTMQYIADVVAVDDDTVKIVSALNDSGVAVNYFEVLNWLVTQYIVPKSWTQKLEARTGTMETLMADTGEDVVASGPYKFYSSNAQMVAFIRDDNYWGKDASMWGKLPTPKYIAHTIYADNAAQEVAFRAGDIDVNQQFIPNIQNLWLEDGLPISTYMDEAPYGICVSTPSMFYNFNNPVLADNTALRKAIAWAIDYDQINANAMTGQSPSFADVPRSLMDPTAGQQALYNKDAVADLQWVGKDIEGAKKLLDDAGIVDTDGDGYREYNGENIELNVCCPNGWSDWVAMIEITVSAGQAIGINLVAEYPEWDVYQTVFTNPAQTDYDMFMYTEDGAGPAYPWLRVRRVFSSEWNDLTTGNWNGNFGRYSNPEGDQLYKDILAETDEAKLKDLYTQAVALYLTEVPSFDLTYRPEVFHAVNESVWTSYPSATDGKNIPPTDCTDGYGIAALYNLTLVG